MTIVTSGQIVTVPVGATDTGDIVQSSGTLVVAGTVVGTIDQPGGLTIVQPGGVASNSVDLGPEIVTGSAGVVGIDINATIVNTFMSVQGGVASNTTVDVGELQVGDNGLGQTGLTIGAAINGGGTEEVFHGGVARNTTINNGFMTVFGPNLPGEIGGVANNTTISNGAITVSSGGSNVSALVLSGATLTVDAGGSDTGTTVASGDMFLNGNATFDVVENNGILTINSGGVASNAQVNGGTINVSSGGTAIDESINKNGIIAILIGAAASGSQINSGGMENVDGGTTFNTTVNNKGNEFVSGGTASNTFVGSGGQQTVGGGSAVLTEVGSGGEEIVIQGGHTIATQVANGGFMEVNSGGVAISTRIEAGGSAVIGPGGSAVATTIDGGFMDVDSGGVLAPAISNVPPQQVEFTASGGTLLLDDSKAFSGVIGGFGPEAAIDLRDFAFSRNLDVSFKEDKSLTSGTLTIKAGKESINLTLLGQYITADFRAAGDGAGGVVVTDPPVNSATSPVAAVVGSGTA